MIKVKMERQANTAGDAAMARVWTGDARSAQAFDPVLELEAAAKF